MLSNFEKSPKYVFTKKGLSPTNRGGGTGEAGEAAASPDFRG